jgi:hypothetical protein
MILQTVLFGIILESIGFGVKPVQAIVGTNPQKAFFVINDAVY